MSVTRGQEKCMTGLLPENLITELLKGTGVYGGRSSRLIRTPGSYRPFTVTRKKSDLDIKFVEQSLDRLTERLDADWKSFYIKEATLTRNPYAILPLRKSSSVKDAICCRFSLEDSPLPLLVYFDPATLYFILAKYFGGEGAGAPKKNQVMTEIETRFLTTVLKGFKDCFLEAFGVPAVKLEKINCSAGDQRESLKSDHVVAGHVLKLEQGEFKFAVCLPVSFLQILQSSLKKKQPGQTDEADPVWQRTLMRVISKSDVKVDIHLGQLKIPFSKSVDLHAGDVLSWQNQAGARVELSFLGEKRMRGIIGTVGDNYAIQVDEVL